MNNYLINTRQKAEKALRRGKPQGPGGSSADMYPAIIIAANGSGWDVATVDAQGNVGRTYDRVFSHPVGETFSADQEVWLWIPGDGETPVILSSGGGGACSRSFTDWGILF